MCLVRVHIGSKCVLLENITPHQLSSLHSKTGVCKGITIFHIFDPKHRLWVPVRTAAVRRF